MSRIEFPAVPREKHAASEASQLGFRLPLGISHRRYLLSSFEMVSMMPFLIRAISSSGTPNTLP
jgi:hypothetical protein